MRRLAPGELVAIAAVAAPLAADVLLVRSGHETVSTCVRRSPVAKGVVLFMAAHLLFTLRHDPLRWAGGRIPTKR